MDFENKIIQKIYEITAYSKGFSMKDYADTWKQYKDRVPTGKFSPEFQVTEDNLGTMFFNDLIGELFLVKSFRILSSDIEKEFGRYVKNHHLVKFFGAEKMYGYLSQKK